LDVATESERAAELLWEASMKRYHERQRREARALWFAHFCQMADNHARLASEYERRAEQLCEDPREEE
jgi:hypothetical protein